MRLLLYCFLSLRIPHLHSTTAFPSSTPLLQFSYSLPFPVSLHHPLPNFSLSLPFPISPLYPPSPILSFILHSLLLHLLLHFSPSPPPPLCSSFCSLNPSCISLLHPPFLFLSFTPLPHFFPSPLLHFSPSPTPLPIPLFHTPFPFLSFTSLLHFFFYHSPHPFIPLLYSRPFDNSA